MAVSGIRQVSVVLTRLLVPLHAHASPVVTGFAYALITTIAHLNPLCFTALLRQGRNTGIRAQPGTISGGKQMSGFGQERGRG